MITSTQQGWLPAGYWPLWSSSRELLRTSWCVVGGPVPFAAGKDGDGQTSDRRPKLRPHQGRGGGHVEKWFGRDGRRLRGEEAAGE